MSVGLALAMFPVTFWLQMQFGYEVALFPLYMPPIAVLSWHFGWKGMIFSVILATVLWYWGTVSSGFVYNYDWARYYNAGVRGLVFLMMGFLIRMFKVVIEQHRRRMEAMRALLNVCHGCGSVQGSDGRWIPFDELVAPKIRPMCECPRCTKAHQESIGTGH